jgi:ABC-2 type transport system permease protein
MSPLKQLVWARLKQFFREPGAVFWTFGFPLLVAVVLGLAFRHGGTPKVPVVVLAGQLQSERIGLLAQDGRFMVTGCEIEEVDELFRRGKTVLAVGGDIPISYLFDPQHDDASRARQLVDEVLQSAAGRVNPLATADEKVTASGARYIDFLIPGLLGFNIMSSSLWGMAWPIVQTRRRKLLKRLAATPMYRSHYLLSFILARLAFVLAEVVTLVLFAWLVFDVQVQGSFLILCVFSVLGAMSFAGFGLLAASRTESAETTSGVVNLIVFPMMLLSGVFFSYAHYPDWMQPFIGALPLTLFNDGLRGIFNGVSPVELLWPLLVLGLYGLVTFLSALRLFKWM